MGLESPPRTKKARRLQYLVLFTGAAAGGAPLQMGLDGEPHTARLLLFFFAVDDRRARQGGRTSCSGLGPKDNKQGGR